MNTWLKVDVGCFVFLLLLILLRCYYIPQKRISQHRLPPLGFLTFLMDIFLKQSKIIQNTNYFPLKITGITTRYTRHASGVIIDLLSSNI